MVAPGLSLELYPKGYIRVGSIIGEPQEACLRFYYRIIYLPRLLQRCNTVVALVGPQAHPRSGHPVIPWGCPGATLGWCLGLRGVGCLVRSRQVGNAWAALSPFPPCPTPPPAPWRTGRAPRCAMGRVTAPRHGRIEKRAISWAGKGLSVTCAAPRVRLGCANGAL